MPEAAVPPLSFVRYGTRRSLGVTGSARHLPCVTMDFEDSDFAVCSPGVDTPRGPPRVRDRGACTSGHGCGVRVPCAVRCSSRLSRGSVGGPPGHRHGHGGARWVPCRVGQRAPPGTPGTRTPRRRRRVAPGSRLRGQRHRLVVVLPQDDDSEQGRAAARLRAAASPKAASGSRRDRPAAPASTATPAACCQTVRGSFSPIRSAVSAGRVRAAQRRAPRASRAERGRSIRPTLSAISGPALPPIVRYLALSGRGVPDSRLSRGRIEWP